MSQLVNLNVGGKKYTTTVQTLRYDPNSMLAKMFSDNWRQSGTTTKEESFIDRDGKHFRHVLNYLRDGMNMILPVDNANVLNELIHEAEFYQLRGFAKLLESKVSTSQSTSNRELTKLISKNYSVLFIVAKLSDLNNNCHSCYFGECMSQMRLKDEWYSTPTQTTIRFDSDSYQQFISGSDGLKDMLTKKFGNNGDNIGSWVSDMGNVHWFIWYQPGKFWLVG